MAFKVADTTQHSQYHFSGTDSTRSSQKSFQGGVEAAERGFWGSLEQILFLISITW
jgi:hypothetical protein